MTKFPAVRWGFGERAVGWARAPGLPGPTDARPTSADVSVERAQPTRSEAK